MPAYGKFFKELNTYKRKYGPNEKVMVSENVSAVLQRKLPPKLKDPGSFSIDITIGGKLVEKAMLDLGASINLMPYSVPIDFCLAWQTCVHSCRNSYRCLRSMSCIFMAISHTHLEHDLFNISNNKWLVYSIVVEIGFHSKPTK
ncbi:unnamed protein product [Prunus brigantina]